MKNKRWETYKERNIEAEYKINFKGWWKVCQFGQVSPELILLDIHEERKIRKKIDVCVCVYVKKLS